MRPMDIPLLDDIDASEPELPRELDRVARENDDDREGTRYLYEHPELLLRHGRSWPSAA